MTSLKKVAMTLYHCLKKTFMQVACTIEDLTNINLFSLAPDTSMPDILISWQTWGSKLGVTHNAVHGEVKHITAEVGSTGWYRLTRASLEIKPLIRLVLGHFSNCLTNAAIEWNEPAHLQSTDPRLTVSLSLYCQVIRVNATTQPWSYSVIS